MTSPPIEHSVINCIIFRIDANTEMGVGHVMRCLALIEALINVKVRVVVLYVEMPEYLLDVVISFGAQVQKLNQVNQAKQIIELNNVCQAKFVVLDGYHFEKSLLSKINKAGVNTVYFDDINNIKQITTRVLINACPDALKLGYKESAPDARHLLGLDYAMINPLLKVAQKLPFEKRTAITMCFGGSDVKGLTYKLLNALAERPTIWADFQVQVITGQLVNELEMISQKCEELGFTHFIQPSNLAELLSKSLIAVAAPGNLVYELAYFNVPSVLLTVADNQEVSAHYHQRKGWTKVIDGRLDNAIEEALNELTCLTSKPEQLFRMHQSSLGLIDGNGAKRLAEKLFSLVNSGEL